ncbi:hypothetical protein [Variovorax paradoxus]|uniref:hypothetical protein n=1 Tax=Variovorax paradoxus TaxID=34073 RepID=UPI003D64F2C6
MNGARIVLQVGIGFGDAVSCERFESAARGCAYLAPHDLVPYIAIIHGELARQILCVTQNAAFVLPVECLEVHPLLLRRGNVEGKRLLPQHSLAVFIDAVALEHELCQVDANSRNLQDGCRFRMKWLVRFHSGTEVPSSGGGVHPIADLSTTCSSIYWYAVPPFDRGR